MTEGKGATYTPTKDDVGMYLRATATYTDGEGEGKTAYIISRARTLHKMSEEPRFLDEDGAELAATDTNNDDAFDTTGPIIRKIAENARQGANVGHPVAAVDIGDNGRPERLTYTLGGADLAKFDIGRSNGQIRVKSGFTPDHEGTANTANNCATLNDCRVTVTVTDPSGKSNTVPVNIEITDVNETPDVAVPTVLPATVTGTRESGYKHAEPTDDTSDADDLSITFVAPDPEEDALDWKLTGTDADDFEIDGNTGILTFKDAPDFEAPTDSGRNNGYDVTVQITDEGGNTVSQRVRVTVTNVEEAGSITLSHTQPEVGARLTATLTDPDRAKSPSWQWYRGDASADGETLEADATESCSDSETSGTCAIDRATSATYRPVADDTGVLTVRASYTDGQGSGKSVIFTTTATVQLEDEDNEPPQFLDGNEDRITRDTREIREDAVAGANVVGVGTTEASPVSATDGDTDNADDNLLVYTLSGTDARYFEIEPTNGQITVGANTVLDYEGRKSYRVTVRALDPSAESAQITVTINVTDVDEPPEVSEKGLAALGDGNVLYPENGGQRCGPVHGNRAERQ